MSGNGVIMVIEVREVRVGRRGVSGNGVIVVIEVREVRGL